MLISMNWISDFVDLSGLDIENLIHRFTLSTAEVEEIIHKGSDIENVVVGLIQSISDHPDSKKLHLLKVDAGDGVYDVVCGAPNVRVGMKVPFAKSGGQVCGTKINKATVAGFESFGMCCSAAELGISADHSGLMELHERAPIGEDIKEVLWPIEDIIFEVDNKSLTNRPDLWGHYGIAREFAALSGRPLKKFGRADLSKYSNLPSVEIDIKDPLCYRYSSVKVDNVTVKSISLIMKIRLFYCGMRSINLLADMTNYIMLEMGQPMHAFDLCKVDKINVRRFDNPFQFETLDNTVRNIDEDTLMICCGDTPVAVAGIMGGFDSEISGDTSSLLIESANFDGVSIRKSSTRLGLRTDASMRYEKMLDPELTVPALERYVYLLSKIDRGIQVISSLSDSYVKHYDTINLSIDKAYVDRYTGIDIPVEQMRGTLESLGFNVGGAGNSIDLTVPSWRATKDVTIKADIIEEITRIYGYDNFEITTTLSPLAPAVSSQIRKDDSKVKDLLCDTFGLHEVHSYLWCDTKKMSALGLDTPDNPRLVNSISPDSTLRQSTIPTLLCMLADNKSFAEDFGIFEIGRVVNGLDKDGKCDERKKLGIALFSRTKSEKELYLSLKDMISALGLAVKNIAFTYKNADKPTFNWQHPVNTAEIIFHPPAHSNKIKLGKFYAIDPVVSQKIDKKAVIVCSEIDMPSLYPTAVEPTVYAEPSKFPGIDYDLSLLAQKNRPFADIADVINNHPSKNLTGYTLIDIYEHESLGDNKVVTVRLAFSSPERTLEGTEVHDETGLIIGAMEKQGIILKK